MQASDIEVIKDIPGYKVILKAVLKSQIQQLVEQLADHTGEESVILTASVSDGSLSHLGSESGKVFLNDHDDIKSQFLGFCLKRYQRQKEIEKERQQRADFIPRGRETSVRASSAVRPRLKSSQQRKDFPAPVMLTSAASKRIVIHSANDGTPRVRQDPYPSHQRKASAASARQQFTNVTETEPLAVKESETGNSHELKIDNNKVVKIEAVDPDDEFNKEGETTIKTEVSSESEVGNTGQLQRSSSPSWTSIPPSTTSVSRHPVMEDSTLTLNLSQAEVVNHSASESLQASITTLETENSDSVSVPKIIIKTEPDLESEMDLEITGVEPGTLPQETNDWIPNVHTGVGYESPELNVPQGEFVGNLESQGPDRRINSTGTSRKLFQCEFCEKSFNTLNTRSLHTKNFHSDNPPTDTVCLHCNRRFSSKYNLKAHIALIHMGEKKFSCSKCGKWFPSNKDLASHDRQQHCRSADKLRCTRCGALFGYKSSLTRHQESCMTKNRFSCSHCMKHFGSRNSLYAHRRAKHSNTVHICEICGKTFDRQYSRTRHLKICSRT